MAFGLSFRQLIIITSHHLECKLLPLQALRESVQRRFIPILWAYNGITFPILIYLAVKMILNLKTLIIAILGFHISNVRSLGLLSFNFPARL